MKNHQQKNRNHQPRQNQPRQNQQPQQRDLMAALARIDITDSMVSVPRDEYDELLYCSALVDILRKLYETSGKYAISDLVEKLFKETDNEKEDK